MVPETLRSALADRFEIQRELGRGGMATVYLAYDRKHHRDVALKVLRPDLAATIGSDRFLAEIQIAARLTHPHILALHDSGEAEGFLYYVMPCITGGSMRDRLVAERRIPLPEAMAIAGPVADALEYAHSMGILHRDIKPENILLSHGHPMVGDFGIAKAISTAGGANLTRTGFPLGTPGYMSPEQAAGLTDLDPQTDVYSLAIVIYEMLVGDIPGRWPSEQSVREGRFLEASTDHRARLSAAGPAAEGALVRALAVQQDQRTRTPLALLEQLTSRAAPPRRRYDESEVREIVKRASEMEARETTGAAMTIGGVESLAAEVGLAPDRIRAAAESLPRTTPVPADDVPDRRRILGGPTELVFERVVEGELPDGDFPALAEEIRRALKTPGQLSQFGHSFSWVASRVNSSRRDLEVSVTVRAGHTRIAVHENLGPLVGAIWGGIGGGMGGGGLGPVIAIVGGALNLPAALGIIIPAWLLTTFSTARSAYYHSVRKRRIRLDRLADNLARSASELIAAARALPASRKPRLPGRAATT